MPMVNCCLVNLKDMLAKGFKLGGAELESPKSVTVACAVAAQVVAQVASVNFGGTTLANLDTVMEPYIKASYAKHMKDAIDWNIPDKEGYAKAKTEKEVFDAYQAIEYEISTLHSSNGQTPFLTITFGTGTSWEARAMQKAILENRIRGMGKHGNTPVFPKLVMFLGEGLNLKPEDPNYDIKQLAIKCSSKRMYPDYISIKHNLAITGSSVPVSPMGCRSFLSVWKDENGNEVLDGRCNLGVVTLNLPRIALIVNAMGLKSVEERTAAFLKELTNRMPLCYDALMSRVDNLKGTKCHVAPVIYTEGAFFRANADDLITDKLLDGRASISLGYIGIHEVLTLLFKVDPIESEEAQRFGKHILEVMRRYVDDWKKKTGVGFSLYGTPAESLCYRFNRLDRERFGVVKGATDKDWFTNSFHLSVDTKVDPFTKILYEKDYHYLSSGGMISYTEFPDMENNVKGLEQVIDFAMEHLHYYGVNTKPDTCYECGSTTAMTATDHGFECPVCGNNDLSRMRVIRRVSGYLGSVDLRPFNHGKHQEMIHRVEHF